MTIVCYQVLSSGWLSFLVSTQLSCLTFPRLLLFIIIRIFSTHFAIKLFYLHNLKTSTMEQQLNFACERTKSKQNKTKSCQVQIDYALYCSI